MNTIAVIDFETTGLSPTMGDRATEVAIVLMDGDKVVGRFQSLMNAGVRISPFIESFTGISNAMVAAAPSAAEVMAEASRFVGDTPMVAHNASFDRRFWQAELTRAGKPPHSPLPALCWSPGGFIRRRPVTSLVCSWTITSCPRQGVRTGRWLMRTWRFHCCIRFNTIYRRVTGFTRQIMPFWWHCNGVLGPQ